MPSLEWLQLFQEPLDVWGFVLYVLIFPIYHALYPLALMRLFPQQASRTRFDRFRRSWIEGIVERKDFLLAAQQTRNLTMVNTFLASSSLILTGFTATVLIDVGRNPDQSLAGSFGADAAAEGSKLLLLILVFGAAFAYSMTSLRHLSLFTIVIGAERDLIREEEGSAVGYLSDLINRASNRHTLAVRCLYSATPIFLWLFDTRLFLGGTLLWGFKFIVLQDFHRRSGKEEPPSGEGVS